MADKPMRLKLYQSAPATVPPSESKMKAITIWQPWASLIIAGVKLYEFRGWRPPDAIIGSRIAIHAGMRAVRRAEIAALIVGLHSPAAWTTGLRPGALPLLERWHANPRSLLLSSVLGTVQLGLPRRANEIAADLGGPVNDSDRGEHTNWAWPMLDPWPLEPPIPARGAQGFWEWHHAVD